MRFARRALFNIFSATVIVSALAACGGGGTPGGGALPPGSGGIASHNTAASTASPAPSPTPLAVSTLPMLTDTSTSTSGVFLGADCGPLAKVSCPNFASTFRHGIAVGGTYTGWDMDLGKFAASENFAGWSAAGITPLITWQPHSIYSNITYSGIIAGSYDAYIKTSADELRGLGYTVFLRPFHEFNGTWYSWGLPNQGASSTADTQFIAAWQHMVNIFRRENATNVKFVWCYSGGSVPSAQTNPWNNPPNAYPGDAYVDWIGVDSYNRGAATGNWRTFDQIFSGPYNMALTISTVKPVMLAELASNEYGDGGTMKSNWISQMLSELQLPAGQNPYPHLRALMYFEGDPNGYSYDSASTSPVYNAWVNGIRTVSSTGTLNFRSNGNALDTLTTP